MNGVLVIDKPAGFTSHDVVGKMRRILKTRSVGHTGTLDPFATGVLVVLIGKATRLAQFLDKAEKEYLATIQFGYETDTGDRTGEPKSQISNFKFEIKKEEIENALTKFRGEIWQTPPMYSAKKVQGKKLYELARKGEEIERQAVKINISELEIAKDQRSKVKDQLEIRVVCSAGSYIRVLAEDIGKALETGAHLAELRRTRAGNFRLEQAVTLEELEQLAADNKAQDVLVSPAEAVAHLPLVVLSAEDAKRALNGIKIRPKDEKFVANQSVRMCDEEGALIAIAVFDENLQLLQPRIVLPPENEK